MLVRLRSSSRKRCWSCGPRPLERARSGDWRGEGTECSYCHRPRYSHQGSEGREARKEKREGTRFRFSGIGYERREEKRREEKRREEKRREGKGREEIRG